MTSPIQLGKTYGVLHTESFFSFLGFAKKVGSNETQKIDVYLDNKLIDTIVADKFIQKIDDMYDVENKAFTYNLPTEYIGKKTTISFKNHSSQDELLNSPYTLIDNNHEKFNEAKFMHSLNEPLSEELKNMYKPNSIGFLATKENLEDEEFVEYINQIMVDFPEYNFKALYFNKNLVKEIKEKFKKNNLAFIELDSINNIFENIEIYLSDIKQVDLKLYNYLYCNSFEIVPIGLNLNINSNTTIKQYSKSIDSHYKKFFEDMVSFGFDKKDAKKYGSSFIEIYYKKAIDKYNINIKLNINESIRNFLNMFLSISFKNHNFLKDLIEFRKKYKDI